jgi:hypothetical protein
LHLRLAAQRRDVRRAGQTGQRAEQSDSQMRSAEPMIARHAATIAVIAKTLPVFRSSTRLAQLGEIFRPSASRATRIATADGERPRRETRRRFGADVRDPLPSHRLLSRIPPRGRCASQWSARLH